MPNTNNEFVWNDELVKEFANHAKKIFNLRNNYCGKYESFDVDFENWKKSKQPLFLTKDNVNIYEGDKVALINIETGSISYPVTAPTSPFYGNRNQFKYFSTKEAATEYVDNHKKRFSVADLKTVFSTKQFIGTDFLLEELGKL